MTTPARREPRRLVPDILDWLESPFTGMLPFTGQTLRIEDYVADGRYVLRAELPGVDPDKDVEVTLSGDVLTIRAERAEEPRDRYRSEFKYGTFSRSVTLPRGANADDVTATYDKGILEVSIGLGEPKPAARRIEVRREG